MSLMTSVNCTIAKCLFSNLPRPQQELPDLQAETFVIPSSVAGDIIAQARGDISKLEHSFGRPQGCLETNPVRVDITKREVIALIKHEKGLYGLTI